jgi:hypothetical protein
LKPDSTLALGRVLEAEIAVVFRTRSTALVLYGIGSINDPA